MRRTAHIAILILTLALHQSASAQEPKALPPDDTHTNQSGKTEYILSEEDFNSVLTKGMAHNTALKKISLLEEQTGILRQRIVLADSAVTLKRLEAQFWYDKLLQTDKALEKERIARTRFWNSRTFWFVVGAVTAAVVIDVE